MNKKKLIGGYSILFLLLGILISNGKNDYLGMVPIGNYPEKDFHRIYFGEIMQIRVTKEFSRA